MSEAGEVQLHFLDYWRVIKVRFGIILLAFLLVVITAGVTVAFLPRQYFSKVTLEVKPDDTVAVNIFGPNSLRGSDPRFAPTQFQILQSKEILYPVIEKLKLDEKLGGPDQKLSLEQTYLRLQGQIALREVRNTDLIEIGVYDRDASQAADIANMIASVYQDRRTQDQIQLVDRALSQLQEEVKKQRETVEEAGKAQAKIASDEGIIDLNPDTLEYVQPIENQEVMRAQERYDESKAKVAQLSSQLEQIKNLPREDLMTALRLLDIDDPTSSQILLLSKQTEGELANLTHSGLGRNHPKVRALRAQLETYSAQLAGLMKNLRANLEARLRIAQDTSESLESSLSGSRDSLTRTKAQSTAYLEAKNKYIQAKEVLKAAEMRLSTERMQRNISMVPAKVWDKAEPASHPSKPKVLYYMMGAVLSGLIVGIGLAFFIEYLDTSVKTVEDVESYLGINVLGVIRKGVVLLNRIKGDSPDAEAYRTIRSNIEFNRKNPAANTITVVSGGPGEGKSTTLANLAIVSAQGGYRVLIVDADLRRPSQHTIFEIENERGLTNHLMGELSVEEAARRTGIENLYLIPSGVLPEDAVGMLSSHKMIELIKRVKGSFDLIFFDSPPILGLSDASVLAKEADMTLMVIQYRRFPRSMLRRVKQAIANVGGNLLGAVLNNVDRRHDETYQYYTSYYDYYNLNAPKKSKARVPSKAAAGGRDEY